MPALYRAAPAGSLLVAPLDAFTAVFHRPSGITHLLIEPAPEILAAIGDDAIDEAAIGAWLADRFELGDADRDALRARLAELVEAGLVQAV